MLIGIDCRIWYQTGVGTYIRNLVLNLENLDKKNDYIIFSRSDDYEEIKSKISNPKWKIEKADIKWHSFSEQTKFTRVLNSYKLDLMHFPYFSVPIFYRKHYVVTVHDLIINKFATGKASTLPYPIYLGKRILYKIVLKNAINKSKKIIVPSNLVKEDILSSYENISPSKIEVTYEAGFEKIETFKAKLVVPGKYFLRVGNFYPHKNVETLLLAFRDFVDKNKNVKLVLVGTKDFFYKRIQEQIKKLNISQSVIIIYNSPREELVSLYKNSLAVIIPSFMEGFSLTSVEAMSCGSPVLASDIPVHREICKEAAIFFNPKDSADLTKKMTEILELPDNKRKNLIEKGLIRSNDFSWEKMAKQTLEIYENSTSPNSA